MTLDKRARAAMEAHCGQIHEDDGVDPLQFFKRSKSRSTKNQRKSAQLCAQVAETLRLVLAGDFDDPRLHNLDVVSVKPAADGTQLVVQVREDLPGTATTREEMHQCLTAIAGRLRSEVAAAITRKRVPRLVFHVLSTQISTEGQP